MGGDAMQQLPPRPENPEKDTTRAVVSQALCRAVDTQHLQIRQKVAEQKQQQNELTDTLNALNKEVAQLEDLEALLASNEQTLKEAMHSAEQTLIKARTRSVPDADDILVAPTIVARQLYRIVAEEQALDDCRRLLEQGLDKNRLSAALWAKACHATMEVLC